MSIIYRFKFIVINITDENRFHIKFSLRKFKHSRFSANKYVCYSSDNVSSDPPDKHHSSDNVYWRRRGAFMMQCWLLLTWLLIDWWLSTV